MRWISDKAQRFFEYQWRLQKRDTWLAILLDSSLITATLNKKYYNCKVFECGNYIQVFKTDREVLKTFKDDYEPMKKELKPVMQKILLEPIETKKTKKSLILKEKEEKNLIRAKNNMCRLILANDECFKTFITLTFKDDVTDVNIANQELHKFTSKIKRVYKDFKYICVPEFTKKNRIHYHMITNIDYLNEILLNENVSLVKLYNKLKNKTIVLIRNNNKSIDVCYKMNDFKICLRRDKVGKLQNTKKTYSTYKNKFSIFKTIKYWNGGYSNVMMLNDICQNNIVGYMSKYMTKDVDSRLFGFRSYTYSKNLIQPKVIYLDLNNELDELLLDVNYFSSVEEVRYMNEYQNKFGHNISFTEFKKLT